MKHRNGKEIMRRVTRRDETNYFITISPVSFLPPGAQHAIWLERARRERLRYSTMIPELKRSSLARVRDRGVIARETYRYCLNKAKEARILG